MKRRPFLWLIVLGIGWLAAPEWTHGQDPGRRYVAIPFKGNLEDMLRLQLNQDRLNDLIKKLPIDPKNIDIDPKALGKMPWGKQKKEVEAWIDKSLAKVPVDQKRPLREKIEEAIKKMAPPPKVNERAVPMPNDKWAGRREENLESRFGHWVRDWMKNAENTDIGDMLHGSAAWQEGLKDFERFLARDDGVRDFLGLGKLNLPMPRDLNIDLGQAWTKLKSLSLPSLPAVKMPHLSIGPLPGLNLPGLPSGSLALGQAAVWVLVVLGLVLVGWQMLRRVGRPGQAGPSWQLGPWPVDPARISSRAELIAAFEHLALLCLGRQARTWNHRAIADGLGVGTDPQRHRAAAELASLYEWARYAPDPASLSEQALANVRRDLCFLAGAAAS